MLRRESAPRPVSLPRRVWLPARLTYHGQEAAMGTPDSHRRYSVLAGPSGRCAVRFALAALLALAGVLLPPWVAAPTALAADPVIFHVGLRPLGVAVTPDGHRLYVTDTTLSRVSVFDTATNKAVGRVRVGSSPSAVAVTPDGRRAYVTNAGSDDVSVFDTATDEAVARVRVGSFPFGVALSPDGRRAYVTNAGSDDVSVIDTATNEVVGTLSVSAAPRSTWRSRPMVAMPTSPTPASVRPLPFR